MGRDELNAILKEKKGKKRASRVLYSAEGNGLVWKWPRRLVGCKQGRSNGRATVDVRRIKYKDCHW